MLKASRGEVTKPFLITSNPTGLQFLDYRWRLFGDVSQERQICCKAISWLLNSIIVVCNGPDPDAKPGGSSGNGSNSSSGGYELLLLPKYHLDLTSLLCRFVQKPDFSVTSCTLVWVKDN